MRINLKAKKVNVRGLAMVLVTMPDSTKILMHTDRLNAARKGALSVWSRNLH